MSNTARNKLNRLARTHFPGGSGTLDLLELVHKMRDRHAPGTEIDQILTAIETRLNQIVNEMRDKANELRKEP